MAKKTLTNLIEDNPVNLFMTPKEAGAPEVVETPRAETSTETAEKAIQPSGEGRGGRTPSFYGEAKTKRLQLLVRPSLDEKLRKKAMEEHLSLNEFVHRILDNAVK